MADPLEDLTAKYGTASEPMNFAFPPSAGTEPIAVIAGVANRRIYIELADVVSDTAVNVGIAHATTPVWGPVPAGANMQYTASGLLGGVGEAMNVTRSASAAIGGGGIYRLLGPAPT